MRLFVATHATQGTRKNDFDHVPDGEIVVFPLSECDDERVDGPCGCRRAMFGLDSNVGTTTAQVVDVPLLTHEDLVARLRLARMKTGLVVEPEVEDLVREEADELMQMGLDFSLGAIVERRGNQLRLRRDAAGAVSLDTPLSTYGSAPVK